MAVPGFQVRPAASQVWRVQQSQSAVRWRPARDIDFLVMAGEGGGADLAVRFLVKLIADKGWCPVAMKVVNRPGRSGLDALADLARRAGDPHVLLFTLNSFYTAPLGEGGAGIDVATFAPIGRLAEDNFLLWVSTARSEITSLETFVEVARRSGKDWIMGGTGRDSEDQLLTDFLNVSYDLRMSYKPFRGGGAVARALAAGEVHSTVNNPSETAKLLAERKVKPLVSFSAARLPELRTVPTLRETGMSFTYAMQRSVVGAGRVPAPAQVWYADLFKRLFDSEEWQAYRKANSLFGSFITGAELTRYWSREREKHKRWLAAMKAMRA
ncbi:MAG: tripartite tricarboxylate transporter substrate-binding protein [Hyphomicrobiaceae bacterium]